jgi:ribonucleotide reductase alpha subunit
MPNPEHRKMTAMHFYGWEKGLKTGQYYLRSRPARDAIKFTVNVEALLQAADQKDETKIIGALQKVKDPSPQKNVNLGRKVAAPREGFSGDAKQTSAQKVQKVNFAAEEEEEDDNPFECLNCGS